MMQTMRETLRSRPWLTEIHKPISELALGTAFYRLDGKKQWFAILDEFLRLGGTLIDSGRHYGDSEAVIGQWLEARGIREHVVLCTKCGHGDYELPTEGFEDMVTAELESSLRCLKTDYVDVYMLHRDNLACPVATIIERLNLEVQRGRVGCLGASNWTYSRLEEANRYAFERGLVGFTVVSNNLSLAVPAGPFWKNLVSVDEAGQQWHQRTGIPLVAWSSQARGFFTGRWTPQMRVQADTIDDVFTKKMLEVYCTDENFQRLARAKEIASQKGGYSATEVALAWVLGRQFPIVPVVGPHNEQELGSCVNALSIELTEAEMQWLNLEI
jgi:1-deoxyxylulose-5-phosphate synthase